MNRSAWNWSGHGVGVGVEAVEVAGKFMRKKIREVNGRDLRFNFVFMFV